MNGPLGFIDLDLLDDLISDNATGIEIYFAAQGLLLAIMIAVAVRYWLSRSPVQRILNKRFFGL